ncbi:hypothetical protein FQA39_LY13005 [Lamprigera yunnana]|nr:hypothetical protein FQA39_LY13005 [Lamprigera yunnana]
MRTSKLFEKDSTGNFALKKEYVQYKDLYAPFLEEANPFTKEIIDTDNNEADKPTRYGEFAEQELQAPPKVPYLTYVNPFTRPSYASGESEVKIYGTTMISRLSDFTGDAYDE